MAYIEREAYSKALKDLISDSDGRTNYEKGYIAGLATANGILLDENQTPAAEVVEVRHGHWRKIKSGYWCSNCCLVEKDLKQEYNYCPHCGAKMDGKDGE